MTPRHYGRHGMEFKFYEGGDVVLILEGPEAAFQWAWMVMRSVVEGVDFYDEDDTPLDLPDTREEAIPLVMELLSFCRDQQTLS